LGGVWRPGDIFLIEDIALGLKKGDTISLKPPAEAYYRTATVRERPGVWTFPPQYPSAPAAKTDGVT
jgi:hypothetical protein